MTTKKTWAVISAFELDGQQYKEGDTFKLPDGWVVDEGYTALMTTGKYQGRERVAFAHQVEEGYEEQIGPAATTKLVPVMQGKVVVLPVK